MKKTIRRLLVAASLLALAAPLVPNSPAHAETLPPVRRVSCPGVNTLNSIPATTYSGGALAWVEATPTSCQYGTRGSEWVALEFEFVDGASTPKQVEDRIRADWPEGYGYPFIPLALPALGQGAFVWADLGPQSVHWQFEPGVVASLVGLATNPPEMVRTAQTFRPMMEVYTVPGERTVNGRQWRTTCEKYSATARCRTEIFATTIRRSSTGYEVVNDWAFNSLTYRWSDRAIWARNPLGNTGSWTASDGRRWRTECDTPATGRGACRSYAWVTVLGRDGGKFRQYDTWVFNNQVLFTS